MFLFGIWDEHVLQGCALLGNFKIAVALGSLEFVMQVNHLSLFIGIIKVNFLRKDQDAARDKPICNTF